MFNPFDYLRVIYRRRWLALLVVTLAVALGAAYTWTRVPIYEAQATVLIEVDDPNVISFAKVLEERNGLGDYYQTQYELLQSRALAERTVKALASTEPSAAGAAMSPDDLREGLRIVPVRGSRVVRVGFRGPDQAIVADVANEHARQYIQQTLDTQFTTSKEAGVWLARQLEEERGRVQQSELALQNYREQHDAVSLKSGQDIVVQKLADLNGALTRAKTTRIQREAEYRELSASRNTRAEIDTFPAILANPFIQQLKGDLAKAQREYTQLSQVLGERHPTLLEKKTELEAVEKRLDAEVARVVQSATKAYEAAAAEETSLTRALEEQKREALELNRRGIEYAALEREADSVRTVYQALLQRAKETSVSGDLRVTKTRIIDTARQPYTPISPRPMSDMMLFTFAGVLGAVGLVFGLEYLDDRVKTPEDVTRRLGVGYVGLIPQFRPVKSLPASLWSYDPPGPLIESVRSLRTSVIASTAGRIRSCVVVASTSEGEGKTFVATSLAVALAQADQRVLLIDADLRKPRVHDVVDQPLEPGLSNLLDGSASLEDVLRPTRFDGLTVITAGSAAANAPELLGSAPFKTLFEILQEHYTWIIIDSPPVSSVTDASVLAAHAGGVLFVVASNVTTVRAARMALDDLARTGVPVVGAVLNRVGVEEHPYYFAPYVRRQYGVLPPVQEE